MYDILLMSQSHFNNTQILKQSNAFGIRVCLTKPKIRVLHEAEQYRVIDHAIDDSEVKRMAITQTSVDFDTVKRTLIGKKKYPSSKKPKFWLFFHFLFDLFGENISQIYHRFSRV